MEIDLEKVGMKKGLKYESIYTTVNSKNEKNAAPIGVKCLDKDTIACHAFEGSTTLKNIIETKKYVVNITEDPLTYTLSTIGNLPLEYYTDDEKIAILKDTPAYLIAEVMNIEEIPISNDEKMYIIKSKVTEMVINYKCAKAMNRGIHCLIDSLVNYTRFNIVDDEKKDYFIDRLEENKRIIDKVADEDLKKAIAILKEKMIR